jgi:hypothetical protein
MIGSQVGIMSLNAIYTLHRLQERITRLIEELPDSRKLKS